MSTRIRVAFARAASPSTVLAWLLIAAVVTPGIAGAALAERPMGTTAQSSSQGTGTPTPDANETAASGQSADETTTPVARILEVHADPLAPGDAGEYVLVSLPAGDWTLTDGETAVPLVGPGRVLVTNDGAALVRPSHGGDGGSESPAADSRVVRAPLALANTGERVALYRGPVRQNASPADGIRYGRAREGRRWVRDGDPHWRPAGVRYRDPVRLGGTNATPFVLPDSPDVPLATIQNADRRLFLAGYTLTSGPVVEALLAATERGANVRVLVEAEPVGGVSRAQATALDRLVAAGVQVRALTGPRERFRFHHAKYAVADDRAVVLTENWKPAGVGGADSRGWGVVLESQEASDALAALFVADAGWRDARPWTAVRRGQTFDASPTAEESFRERHPPETVPVERVTLLTAPGNAEAGVVAAIDAADERVDVVQPTVADGPMVSALVRAAERGVEVRLLVSGAWYVAEDNEALVARLNRWAERADAPLTARVAEPAGRYGKIHAKGVLADDVALVGSLNWNPTSAGENREVVLALEGAAVTNYYRQVFTADWRAGRGGDVPTLLWVAAVGAAATATLLVARRVGFGGAEVVDRRTW